MIYTPNLGLGKPIGADYVTPAAFNANSDILDEAVHDLQTDMTAAQADIVRLKSGQAIHDVVAQETKAYLAEHGASPAYVSGTCLIFP